jgi:hypothetical protein
VTVIVLIAVAPGLRGHLTRWMVEVNAGVSSANPADVYENASGNYLPTASATARPS